MGTTQKISYISNRMNQNSGYDYYHTLSKSILAYIEGAPPEQIDSILEAPKNAFEREHNRAAYNAFLTRFGKSKNISSVRKKRTFNIKGALFKIECDPVFSTVEGGIFWVHALWAAQNMKLQKVYGGVGCHILKECYRGTELSNSNFAIVDLGVPYRHSEKSINNHTVSTLKHDAASISRLIEENL